MKRNLNVAITNLDGKNFGNEEHTLGTICFLSVTTPLQTDNSLRVDDKLKMYKLAQKVVNGGIVELEAEDITLLKERIGKVFSHVVIIGRAFELLEADPV